MRVFCLNILFLLSVLAAEGISVETRSGTTLFILDKRTYQPIPFAALTISNFNGSQQILEADKAGVCETSIINGKFRVKISAKGYVPIDTNILFKKDITEITLFLSKVYQQDSAVELTVSNGSSVVQLNVKEEIVEEEINPNEEIVPPVMEKKVAPESAKENVTTIAQPKNISEKDFAPTNLVFLIDCSSSMRQENKMQLVSSSIRNVVGMMRSTDKIALIRYGSETKILLEPTGTKTGIEEILNGLEAGGTTKTGNGLEEAYRLARFGFIENGLNEVILLTDGAFHGSGSSIESKVSEGKALGVSLSVIGIKNPEWTEAGLVNLCKMGGGEYLRLGNEDRAEEKLKSEIKKRSGLIKNGN